MLSVKVLKQLIIIIVSCSDYYLIQITIWKLYIKHLRQCSTTFANMKKRAKNTAYNGEFLTNFKVFGKAFHHCLEHLIFNIFFQSTLHAKLRRKRRTEYSINLC